MNFTSDAICKLCEENLHKSKLAKLQAVEQDAAVSVAALLCLVPLLCSSPGGIPAGVTHCSAAVPGSLQI